MSDVKPLPHSVALHGLHDYLLTVISHDSFGTVCSG